MYKSFRVKNFRCFEDLQIHDLGRVNLIAGKNGMGKTALLEAVYVLVRRTRGLDPPVSYRQRRESAAIVFRNDAVCVYVPTGRCPSAQWISSLAAPPPQYLLIDEIENGIHYSAQREVWQAIDQTGAQVFATTHSYEMIEAAHDVFKSHDPYAFRFHRLNLRHDTGGIEAITYGKAGIEAFIRSDYEVRG